MKEENEIFKEWYELNFEELPSPLEYVYFRNSLDFQRYLLWYQYNELVELISEKIWNAFKKLVQKSEKSTRK